MKRREFVKFGVLTAPALTPAQTPPEQSDARVVAAGADFAGESHTLEFLDFERAFICCSLTSLIPLKRRVSDPQRQLSQILICSQYSYEAGEALPLQPYSSSSFLGL
jgi:hypothetical protein